MKGTVYLALRYLAHHRIKTGVLVASIALVLFVPMALQLLVDRTEEELSARAASTPLLVGAKGSPLELALSSLYFTPHQPAAIPWSEVERVDQSGLARAIPLYVRFRAQGAPIVGTSLDYFDFRDIGIASGRWMGRLGECVIGAGVARARGLGPGDAVISSTESVFDIAGVYPLKMRIAGVLAWSNSPDDDAVFVDTKTAWVIEGLAHGHDDVDAEDGQAHIRSREGRHVDVSTSLPYYREITPENIDSFHFHGDPSTFPITAIIAVPKDDKSKTLLRGRYQDQQEAHQILQPDQVLTELLDALLTVRSLVVSALLLVALATLAVAALVFVLSRRMRQREVETLVKIGASRTATAALLWLEVLIVLLGATLIAFVLAWLLRDTGAELLRDWIR